MKVNPYKAWLGISLTFSVLILISSVFYMYLYIVSIENIISVIQNRPDVFSATSDTKITLIQSYSLSREFIFTNSSKSIFHILPQYNLIPEFQDLSLSKLLKFKRKHTELRLLFEEYAIEDEISSILFNTVDPNEPFLALGLEYSQSVFITDVIYTRGFSIDNFIHSDALNRQNVNLMLDAYEDMSDDANHYLIQKLQYQRDLTIVLLTFFCVILALSYLFVLLPIIYSVEKTILSCWSFFNTFNLGDLNTS